MSCPPRRAGKRWTRGAGRFAVSCRRRTPAFLRAAKQAKGHEQKGVRYAVELQGPLPLSTVIVAPTSTRAASAVFRPDIDMDGTTTKVLVDQMAAVDVALRLGDMVGRLSAREMAEIDLALRLLLGLL